MTGHLDLLLADPDLVALLDSAADLATMVEVELALATASAEAGLIPQEAAAAIVAAAPGFRPDLTALAADTLRDGVVVAGLVGQFRDHVGPAHGAALHAGATSQDIIDTALAIRLGRVLALFETRLARLSDGLAVLSTRFGHHRLIGRTRMQAAIPITVADRLAVWQGLLARASDGLGAVRRANLVLSLAGPAGTSERFGDHIGAVRRAMASRLGLSVPDYVPHAARDRIARLGGWLSEVTGALGKIGQDVALMAQNEIAEIALSGAGGSSAMAHKQNPVRAEVLVTLARFNAVQLSGLHQALVHEQERSGAAWTLEWMILPPMLNATGTALRHADAMLASVERIGIAD
jgi:3-carboxy-cis,cis-muconate cycloisomerase